MHSNLNNLFRAIILFLVLSGSATAQVKLGVKGGGGVSRFSDYPAVFSTGFILNYHLGGFMQVTRYQSKFFIRPELLFSTKGSQLKSTLVSQDAQLSYFSIPVMFGYKPFAKAAVLAGVEPSFMLNSTAGSWYKEKDIDVSLNLGVFYDFTYNVGIELRAGMGLLPLLEVQEVDGAGNPGPLKKVAYNQWVQLSLSYNFAIKELSSIKPVLRQQKH